MGNFTISMAIFNSKLLNYQRVSKILTCLVMVIVLDIVLDIVWDIVLLSDTHVATEVKETLLHKPQVKQLPFVCIHVAS